jgi:hypothetical protein
VVDLDLGDGRPLLVVLDGSSGVGRDGSCGFGSGGTHDCVLRVERGWGERRYELPCEVECGEARLYIYIQSSLPFLIRGSALAAHGRLTFDL